MLTLNQRLGFDSQRLNTMFFQPLFFFCLKRRKDAKNRKMSEAQSWSKYTTRGNEKFTNYDINYNSLSVTKAQLSSPYLFLMIRHRQEIIFKLKFFGV